LGIPAGLKIIDSLVWKRPPEELHKAPEADLNNRFAGLAERRGTTMDDTIAAMGAAGIEKAMVTVHRSPEPQSAGLKVVSNYAGKLLPCCMIEPKDGMTAVRELETLVNDFHVKAVHMSASDMGVPYNDKMFYPMYAKCVELDIPVMMPVGIPVPRVPGWLLDPVTLDEVCWFFPELKVIMTNGGEPWQAMCVKLMVKWPNLYYSTNSFAPKYYPQEIIYFMNTRGADKVLFATGYPLVEFGRAIREINDLPLRDHVWSKFLRENAIKVFKLEA
jgi:predicted TIM-barrel fold metal-dependent hydrolase